MRYVIKIACVLLFLSVSFSGHSQYTITDVLHDWNAGTVDGWTGGWDISSTPAYTTAQKYEGAGALTVGLQGKGAVKINTTNRDWSSYDYLIAWVYTPDANVEVRLFVQYIQGTNWIQAEGSTFSIPQNTWTQIAIDLNNAANGVNIDKSNIGMYGLKNQKSQTAGNTHTFYLDYMGYGRTSNIFYSIHNQDLSDVNNWNSEPDGFGFNPTVFSGLDDIFILQNGHTCTLSSATTIAGTVIFDGNGQLQMNRNLTVGELTASGASNINKNTGTTRTLTVGSLNTTSTFSGTITGAIALTKVGTGTLTLTGNNTFTGITTISAGSLQLGNNSAAGTVGRNIVNNSELIFNRSNDYTYSRVISGAGSLTKIGTGMLTLTGTNTFTGATTILAGTLRAGNNNAFGSADSGTTISTGGTLDINGYSLGTEAFVLAGGTMVNNGAVNIYAIQKVTVTEHSFIGGSGRWDVRNQGFADAGVTINAGKTLTKQDENEIFFVNVPVVNNGSVEINSSYLHLENNCATSGSGTYTVNASGKLGLIAWGAGVTLTNNVIVNNNGTIFSNNNDGGNSTIVGNVTLHGSATVENTVPFSISGVISGTGSLTKIGNAVLTLTGTNTYSGGTTISAGALQLGNNSTTGIVAGNIVNNSELIFYRSNNYTYSGIISGTGNLTKNGNGELNLTNANSYTGTTTILNDRINYTITANGGSNSGIGASSSNASNVILDGGILRYVGSGGSTDRLFTVTEKGGRIYASGTGTQIWTNTGTIVMTGTGNRTLEFGGGTATTNYFAPILPDPVSGTLSVIKTGATNTWVFSGNHTYSGITTIVGGALQIGNNSTTGILPGNAVNNGTLMFARSDTYTYSHIVSGTGHLHQNGTGRLVLRGMQTYTGNTFVNAGELELGGLGTPSATRQLPIGTIVTIESGALLIVSGLAGSTENNEIIGGLQGNGNVTTYNGATVARLTVQNTADYTFSGQISGNVRLQIIKDGIGTLTLSGNNTYQGLTTIKAGTIKLGSTTALGSTDNEVIIQNGGALDLNGILYPIKPLTITGTGVSGSGVIFNSSGSAASFAGNIVLSGASTITANNKITLSGTISPSTQNLTKNGSNALAFTTNTITVHNFDIAAGEIDGGESIINIHGAFTNSGVFTPNVNGVYMLGTYEQTIPAVPFYNLTINNTAGTVLAGNISVAETLTLTNGIFDTDGYVIDLGMSGNLIETAINPSSYILGSIKATRVLLKDINNMFGGIGIELHETNKDNINTTITRVTGEACMGVDGNQGILRYFTINPDGDDSGFNSTMVFHYYDHEIYGHEAGFFRYL